MSYQEDFAEVYAEVNYTDHSEKVQEVLPDLLSEYDVHPDKILDVACGEGTFARGIASEGYDVKGVDISEELIRIARQKSEQENLEFETGDMRYFSESGYDLVTCWYDSLNYMKNIEDLKSVFRNVRSALDGEGYFIFDMNTFYWLSEGWPSNSCYIAHENEELFEVHRASFDSESDIFTLKITGFREENGLWNKFEEEHEEKAYKLDEVKEALKKVGFEVVDVFGDIESRRSVSSEDERAWFITKVGK